MKARRLGRRERVIVAVGLVVIIGATLTVKIGPAWLAWHADARLRVERVDRAVADARLTLQDLPVTVDSLERRTERLIARIDAFVLAPSPEAAAAALGGRISDAAAAHAVRLDESRSRADSTASEGVRFLWTEVRGACDARGLMAWLAELEGGTPVIRVEALMIKQPAASAGPDEPEELAFSATLRALHFPRETEPETP